jgi:hypothetical protein
MIFNRFPFRKAFNKITLLLPIAIALGCSPKKNDYKDSKKKQPPSKAEIELKVSDVEKIKFPGMVILEGGVSRGYIYKRPLWRMYICLENSKDFKHKEVSIDLRDLLTPFPIREVMNGPKKDFILLESFKLDVEYAAHFKILSRLNNQQIEVVNALSTMIFTNINSIDEIWTSLETGEYYEVDFDRPTINALGSNDSVSISSSQKPWEKIYFDVSTERFHYPTDKASPFYNGTGPLPKTICDESAGETVVKLIEPGGE